MARRTSPRPRWSPSARRRRSTTDGLHREIQRLATHEQERAAELESVVRTIGEGVVTRGDDGETRVVNQAARRMLGGGIADAAEYGSGWVSTAHRCRGLGSRSGPAEFHVVERPTAWIELTAYPVPER